MKTALSLILGLSTIAGAAQAFEFKGAELGLEYSRLQDKINGESVAKTTLDGSVEFGFLSNFAVQFDAARHDFSAISETGTTFTLHGIYDVNDQLALGAYWNRLDVAGTDAQYFGLEGKYDFGVGYTEVYFEKDNESGLDSTSVGIMGAWGVSEKLDLTAAFDYLDLSDDGDRKIYTFGTRYDLIENTTLTAELGIDDSSGLGRDQFFALGIEYNFGSNRGTTFGKRGGFNAIPGS
ncbi:hypothetical protein SAMN04488037_1019 [Shimia marina]|uniref:Outer membrane protein (Porin) n=2 Tax=Shimia marina TaxID=321267 RepID=A0A0P1EMT1_9RHOB|nr:Outer membrane protein (porin) [Shimia marina]SFD43697.1 hypothetical protein SAMN04488037_1019 [Shimia marina]